MAINEDEAPKKRRVHEIGQELSALSVEELGHRIEELEAEIARIRGELEAKENTRSAADALFRRG